MKKVQMNTDSWALKILCFRKNGDFNTEGWVRRATEFRQCGLPSDSCEMYSRVITTFMLWGVAGLIMSLLLTMIGLQTATIAFDLDIENTTHGVWAILLIGFISGVATIGGILAVVCAVAYAIVSVVESKAVKSIAEAVRQTKSSKQLGGTLRQLREARKEKFCTEYEYTTKD